MRGRTARLGRWQPVLLQDDPDLTADGPVTILRLGRASQPRLPDDGVGDRVLDDDRYAGRCIDLSQSPALGSGGNADGVRLVAGVGALDRRDLLWQVPGETPPARDKCRCRSIQPLQPPWAALPVVKCARPATASATSTPAQSVSDRLCRVPLWSPGGQLQLVGGGKLTLRSVECADQASSARFVTCPIAGSSPGRYAADLYALHG